METEEVHIKSPDGRFCTRVRALVEKNRIVKILKLLDISLGCDKDRKDESNQQ